jgi:hypothetical protein
MSLVFYNNLTNQLYVFESDFECMYNLLIGVTASKKHYWEYLGEL